MTVPASCRWSLLEHRFDAAPGSAHGRGCILNVTVFLMAGTIGHVDVQNVLNIGTGFSLKQLVVNVFKIRRRVGADSTGKLNFRVFQFFELIFPGPVVLPLAVHFEFINRSEVIRRPGQHNVRIVDYYIERRKRRVGKNPSAGKKAGININKRIMLSVLYVSVLK